MQKKIKKLNINTLLISLILIVVTVSFFYNNFNLTKKAEAGKTDLVDMQFTFRNIAKQLMPQVVEISVVEVKVQEMPQGYSWPFNFIDPNDETEIKEPYEYKSEGLGSGVIVKKENDKYYVLTNNHVVSKAEEIKIKLYDETVINAEIVGIDKRKDIAIIAFDSKKSLSVAQMGNSDEIAIGDIVLAIGSPLGYDSSVTAGIISALGRNGPASNINDFIQTDAAINQGNSGGALVNLDGEVIGINTWIATNTGESIGLGFSIPINNIKKTIDDVVNYGSVKYGWLGVSITDIDENIRKSLNLKEKNGVLVNNVYISSPAAKAGMQAGDFITFAEDEKILDYKQFMRIIGEIKENDKIRLKLLRDGEQKEVTALIELRKEDSELKEMSDKIWPGVIAYPLSEELLKEIELNESFKGVIISVQYGTIADKSGLKDYDIIKYIDNKEIENLNDFYKEINIKKEKLNIKIYRDGQELNIELQQ